MELLFLNLNITEWLTGAGAVVIAGIIVTILRKKGLILKIKSIFSFVSSITEEIGQGFMETSDVFKEMDNAISKDGKLKEGSVKDVIREGKEAIIEWQDVVMIVRPKSKSKNK